MRDLLGASGIVFAAELGDKTQLAAIALAARYRLRPVLIGVVVGYVTVTGLSAAVGAAAGAAIPTEAVDIAAAVLFIVIGALTLAVSTPTGADEPAHERAFPAPRAEVALVASIAAALAIAELGDKTMLATVSLAARGDPVLVWTGAAVGITGAGLLGVAVGRVARTRLAEDSLRVGAGVLFVAIGVVLLVTSIT